MLSNRKKLILKAVIENYSKESQPISSQLLAGLPYLNFSSATIRYDMVQLEKKGYLQKNHKSSGRVPSLKGYIFYLNNLMTRQQKKIPILSLFEKIIKEKDLNKEQIIKKILKLLSNLTNYATISIGSNILKVSKISKIDLILVSSEQAIILIIIDKGDLQYQNICLEKDKNLTIFNLKKVIEFLNNLLVEKTLYKSLELIKSNEIKEKIQKYVKCHKQLISILYESFYNFVSNNSKIYGLTEFFQNSFFDVRTIKEMMFILDKRELNKIFFSSSETVCQINNQIRLIPYKQFIIISIPYYINEDEKGFIGILGPLIMKYQEVIPLLEYLSVHFSQLYEK